MPGVLELAVGFVPGSLWLVHIARKDDWEREPWRVLLAVFVLGAFSAFAIAGLRPRIEALYPPLDGTAALWLDAFAITALSEELAKLAAVALGALWLAEWDEPMDGLVYGSAAGLGFAAVENAYYLAHSGYEFSVLARAVTAMLAHACFTGGGAFVLGLARLAGGARWLGLGALALVVAVVPHGLYDLLLMSGESRGMVALLAVLPGVLVVFSLQLRWARSRSPRYHPRVRRDARGVRAQRGG